MPNKNSRGRPVDSVKQQQQKDKLLSAAESLLEFKSYRNITVREIADQSGINPAMISYYFGNKEGLFIELIEHISKTHFVNMKNIQQQNEPIKHFIRFMLKTLSQNNSLARLVQDEFREQDSRLSVEFINRFPKRMAQVLPNLIKTNTPIKDDTKAKYAAFTLVSMIVTPFIGHSVRKQGWGISDHELTTSDWSDHIYSMFMSGCSVNS